MLRIFVVLLLVCGFVASGVEAAAQTAAVPRRDTTKGKPVQIDFAEVYERIVEGPVTYQKLSGEVELKQGEMYIYCDEAIIRDNDFVRAKGNVVLLQNDTLQLFADSMRYYVDQQLAFLYGKVVLVNGVQKLFTDSLRYDLATKQARYRSRAKLTDGQAQLSSMSGDYDVNAHLANFRDSVFVVGEDFSLISDTLSFNTEARIVYFEGPTVIATSDSRVYCEDGFYNMIDSVGEFRRNAQVARGTQRALADAIYYDGYTDDFRLIGNARFADETRRAVGDTIRYNERTNKTQLLGDATFVDGTQRVQGERINYDGASQTFTSTGRVDISEPPYLLTADSVSFNDSLGLAFVHGQVRWRDTAAQRAIIAEDVIYRRDGEYVKAFGGRPIFSTLVETDSLYISADTLLSFRKAYVLDTISQTLSVGDSTAVDSMALDDVGLDSTAYAKTRGDAVDPTRQVDSSGLGDSLVESLDILNGLLTTLTPPTALPTGPVLPNRELIADSLRRVAIDSAGSIEVTNKIDRQTIAPILMDTSAAAEDFLTGRDTVVAPPLPDSIRLILAYNNVRIYKLDLQAVCDSLAFNSIDSAFTLYRDPLVWSDTSQFIADTITVRLRNEVVDRVLLRSKSLIVNSTDEIFYNQIKGRQVDVDFSEGTIAGMVVRGNAESVYYIQDEEDKSYIGMNYVQASRMRLQFDAGQLTDIFFYEQPEGALEPIPAIGGESKLLEDFRWEIERRPKGKDDLQ